MSDAPEAAITAAAVRLKCAHIEHGVRLTADVRRAIAADMLEAAEEAWPHDPPKRDPASTTNAVTERAWTAPRRAPAQGFGFCGEVKA